MSSNLNQVLKLQSLSLSPGTCHLVTSTTQCGNPREVTFHWHSSRNERRAIMLRFPGPWLSMTKRPREDGQSGQPELVITWPDQCSLEQTGTCPGLHRAELHRRLSMWYHQGWVRCTHHYHLESSTVQAPSLAEAATSEPQLAPTKRLMYPAPLAGGTQPP